MPTNEVPCHRLLYAGERLYPVQVFYVSLRGSRLHTYRTNNMVVVCRFTGQYIHTSAHRSLDFLLQAHEENMFKTLKNGSSGRDWPNSKP